MTEIQSLARGLKILNLLSTADQGMGITELAQYLNIDKSSVSRLLQTLASYGYAEQDPDTRRYTLGAQLVTLSHSLLRRLPVHDQARSFLQQLVEQTGECAHLAILAQGQALYIDQVESPAALRVETGVGTLAPLHCTALGKVFLAFGAAELPAELPAFTPRTLVALEMLQADLKNTRSRGYAVDDEEYADGVRCVAAPVYDYQRRPVGALGISGPAGRMALEHLDDLGQLVLQSAQALSRRLGYN